MNNWKPIPGYPSYHISADGDVLGPLGKILKPRAHTNGYRRVCLGAGNDAYVHRLVALTFLGTPPDGAHADHINGIRHDNRLENIQWLSPQENRARRNVAKGSGHSLAKLDDNAIREIRSTTPARGGDAVLANKFGVARETVRDIRNGKAWRHVAV